MAKIKRVVITLTQKLSDGNYGSFGADVTLEAELEDGDSPKEVKANLLKSATKDLERAVEAVRPAPPEAPKKSKGK